MSECVPEQGYRVLGWVDQAGRAFIIGEREEQAMTTYSKAQAEPRQPDWSHLPRLWRMRELLDGSGWEATCQWGSNVRDLDGPACVWYLPHHDPGGEPGIAKLYLRRGDEKAVMRVPAHLNTFSAAGYVVGCIRGFAAGSDLKASQVSVEIGTWSKNTAVDSDESSTYEPGKTSYAHLPGVEAPVMRELMAQGWEFRGLRFDTDPIARPTGDPIWLPVPWYRPGEAAVNTCYLERTISGQRERVTVEVPERCIGPHAASMNQKTTELDQVVSALKNVNRGHYGNDRYTITGIRVTRTVEQVGPNEGDDPPEPRLGIEAWIPATAPTSGTFSNQEWARQQQEQCDAFVRAFKATMRSVSVTREVVERRSCAPLISPEPACCMGCGASGATNRLGRIVKNGEFVNEHQWLCGDCRGNGQNEPELPERIAKARDVLRAELDRELPKTKKHPWESETATPGWEGR